VGSAGRKIKINVTGVQSKRQETYMEKGTKPEQNGKRRTWRKRQNQSKMARDVDGERGKTRAKYNKMEEK
jgi:hypothetical protein